MPLFPVSFRPRSAFVAVLLALASASPGFGARTNRIQEAVPAPRPTSTAATTALGYTRKLQKADGTTQGVETAIRRFDPVSGNGPTVYLVSAVHIGEKAYYQKVQQFLDKQDLVLFEGVKPPTAARTSGDGAGIVENKTAPTPGITSASSLSDMTHIQQSMAKILNLQFQLTAIDYQRANFRNSDLSWDALEGLAKTGGTRTSAGLGELRSALTGTGSMGTMIGSVLKQAESNPAFAKMFRNLLVGLIADPNRMEALKKQQGMTDSGLNAIVIAARNKQVLTDLKALSSDEKKPLHSVAIFYGAEHMPDMEKRLAADLGYRATDTQWLTAITVAP